MTSTSSDPLLLRAGDSAQALTISPPDLRKGEWTRLGASSVLGDPATESALADLTARSRRAATAQGYAAGWAEGRRKAVEDVEASRIHRETAADAAAARARGVQDSLVSALTAALARADANLAERYADVAGDACELALVIAEAVLAREISESLDPAADAVRRALVEVPPTATATVRLNPADAAALDREVLAGRPVTVLSDPGVARGDALVETESTLVDATVPAAMARIREVLGR